MLSHAVLPLILQYIKTTEKTLFRHWFPGYHSCWCSGNHAPLFTGHTPKNFFFWKYTEVGLESLLWLFSLAYSRRTPLPINRNDHELDKLKPLRNHSVPVVTSGQPASLAPVIRGHLLLYSHLFHLFPSFFLSFFKRSAPTHPTPFF